MLLSDQFHFISENSHEKLITLSLSTHYLTILDKTGTKIEIVLSLDYTKCLWVDINGSPGFQIIQSWISFKFKGTNDTIGKWKKVLRQLVLVSDFHDTYKAVHFLIYSESQIWLTFPRSFTLY